MLSAVATNCMQPNLGFFGPFGAYGSTRLGNQASAWGAEDWSSNRLGGEFIDWLRNQKGVLDGVDMYHDSPVEMFKRFFELNEFGTIGDSQSYEQLPASELEWQKWVRKKYELKVVEGAYVRCDP